MGPVHELQGFLGLLPPLVSKVLLLYAYAALTALWVLAAVRRQRPGWARLSAAAPVVIGNLLIPLVLDHQGELAEPLIITPFAGVFSLAAFKLLAFCIGRGPMVPSWLTPAQFSGVFLLPIVPIQVFTVGPQDAARLHTVKQGRQLLLDSWASTGACGRAVVRVAMLVSWVLAVPGIPVMVRHWLYTLASATFLTGVFDVLAAGAHVALGITSAPTFDKPWLCDSFQDFWARRWNLTTTYMMRVLVYEPIIEGRLLPGPSRSSGAADAATVIAAVFLFSGLWHIAIFWYNTRVFSWRWCAFFAIQIFAANFLLIAVAKPLFFGPADTTGFAARNLAVGQEPLWALVNLAKGTQLRSEERQQPTS
ncbi:hypothetical protein GPECTOR_62g874 [Gonium pectorale]|uniref:Wax synthase domain-containing protein n=1 Tax=Gonium pectorale TaxID=33097 RepID=A0A150G4E4_GONPE|nr:hypothetical protein GPECTOR_62g874 [Gonium pectorale]|eukprot:KXZ44759.1 hypothetical protein GPECTOR_62g874 [Gonium pectorale]